MSGRGGDGAGVADLGGDGRTLGVDDVGQLLQARRRLVGEDDLVRRPAPVGRHRAVGDGRHADAAGGDPPVELDQPIAHHVLASRPLERRRFHDAVADGDRAQLGGGEGVRHSSPWRHRSHRRHGAHRTPILTR